VEPFDAYLDACLEGNAEEPDAYFARHPDVDGEARDLIRALHREARRRASKPALPFPRLGEYVLVRRLGEGGMGQVFLGKQESLDRDVALKILRPEFQASPSAAARFRREAQTVARLRHDHIVAVHAMGEENGVRFIAMEFVAGRNLDEVLAAETATGGPPPLERVLRWTAEISRALAHAHAHGIVHRDVKPSNIRITPEGRARLLDFGLARDVTSDVGSLTATFAGSPHYAAPEQLSGALLDARADVYGLGATLYQCLTGRVPFPGRTLDQVIRRALLEEVLPPRRLDPALPRAVDVVVLKALAKDPDARYASAEAFAHDLEALREGRPIRARPPSPLARARRFARANPRKVAAALLLVAAVATVMGTLAWRGAAEERQRRAEARAAVDEARGRVAELGALREKTAEAEHQLARLREEQLARYFTPEEHVEFDRIEALAKAAARDREALFHGTLDLLRAAERADPDVPLTEEVRALLYAERWKEARAVLDPAAETFYREQVLAHDPSGRIAGETEAHMKITIMSAVPAEVYLFRCLEEAELVKGGERRLVPVGYPQAAEGVEPSAWALRVSRPAGGLEETDVILRVAGHPVEGTVLVATPVRDVERLDRLVAIAGTPVRCPLDAREFGGPGDERDFEFERERRRFTVRAKALAEVAGVADVAGIAEAGGVRGTVYRMGSILEMDLPDGLSLRTTAAPLLPHPGCRAGTTPLTALVPAGSTIALVLAPGRPPVRRDFRASAGAVLSFDLTPPRAPAPPDFVYVADPNAPGASFWILDREVSTAEYAEFLDTTDGARAPRGPDGRPFWVRGADGRLAPARAGLPVYGVSFDDALAYVAWLNGRARARGERHRFALPTFAEWHLAGGGRYYVFGDQFRAKWMNSCFARPKPLIRPGRSFPVDESPMGVFDMAGSMWEWMDDWYSEGRARRVGGGAWAEAGGIELFRVSGGNGATPESTSAEIGFRVTLRVEEDGP